MRSQIGMTRWIYIALFLALSNWTTAQETKPDSLDYGWHMAWDGTIVIGGLKYNRTYDFAFGYFTLYYPPGYLTLYPEIMPIRATFSHQYGNGFRLYVRDQEDKSFDDGYKKGLEAKQHDYEVMRWIFAGTAAFVIVWATLK